jgi:nucleoid-associated protein YgaU
MRLFPKVYVGMAVALAVAGCAHKDEVKPDAAPTPQAAAPQPGTQPQAADQAPSGKLLHYVVRRGDNLWMIASKQGVLGDPMQWPLLYKKNRDQIADPDLIEVDQDLSYVDDTDKEDISAAEQEAKDTPPYTPHSDVRKTLAVNY